MIQHDTVRDTVCCNANLEAFLPFIGILIERLKKLNEPREGDYVRVARTYVSETTATALLSNIYRFIVHIPYSHTYFAYCFKRQATGALVPGTR